jgi:hypothetical protein
VNEVKSILEGHLAKLVAVGDAGQLALHFQAQGIKADRKCASACAIAVSFNRVLREAFPGQQVFIWVNSTQIDAAVGHNHAFSAEHPFEVFVRGFDNGLYPELVA